MGIRADKSEISFDKYVKETINVLGGCGCLLVSGNIEKANVMAIGIGLIGLWWRKPIFMIGVRPTRHTYKFIEAVNDFTINVPKRGMEEIVKYCGSVSGREHDKFLEKGLTLRTSRKVNSPVINECIVHYECRVAYKADVMKSALTGEILGSNYPSGNFHRVYFGEVLVAYANKSAMNQLPLTCDF